MLKATIPGRDVELLTWAQRFAKAIAPYVEENRIGEKEYSELVTALGEYDAAVQEHERVSAQMQVTAMEKMTKRAPLERVLETLAEAVKYHPGKGCDPNFDGKDPAVARKPSQASNVIRPPSISLTAEPGRVLVHFGELPKWASGVCVYRRTAGETEHKMLRFAKKSPYVDEISEEPSKYEYMARYWISHENTTGPESEFVGIESQERMAA